LPRSLDGGVEILEAAIWLAEAVLDGPSTLATVPRPVASRRIIAAAAIISVVIIVVPLAVPIVRTGTIIWSGTVVRAAAILG
jgi:hypothetical protein